MEKSADPAATPSSRTGSERVAEPGRPWLVDGILAAAYFVVALLLVLLAELLDDGADPLHLIADLLLVSATAVAVLLRRRWPVAMSAVVLALSALSVLHGAGADVLALPIMLYTLALRRGLGAAALLLAMTALVVAGIPLLPGVRSGLQDHVQSILLLLFTNAVYDLPAAAVVLCGSLVGLFAGLAHRNRRRYVNVLAERAAQIEREQEQHAQLAAANERTRIARETHDILSHTLTVVVTLADGAVASPDDVAARRAMGVAAEAAREALGELRRLLGTLREADADEDPAIGASGVHVIPPPEETVSRFVRAGLPARLRVDEESDGSATARHAVHCVVQEGLTNALRYSRDATFVEVVIRRADDGEEHGGTAIDVVNDGVLDGAPALGAGHGLRGLRERLSMLGGTVDAGPEAGGRWRLSARIPFQGAQAGRVPAPAADTTAWGTR